LKDGFCKDCTVISVKTDLVYEDGNRADISNGIYVHHGLSFDLAWKKVANWINLCPFDNQQMKDVEMFSYYPPTFSIPFSLFGGATVDEFQQFYGSPNETAPKAGYYIGAEDHFMMQAEVINYTKDPKQIYIQFDYEYLPGKVGEEATMSIVNTLGCFDAIGFYGKSGAGVIKSKDFKVLQDGTILAARGHLHDGGEHMNVLLNDKLVCTSNAVYGTKMKNANGKEWTTLSAMTTCVDPIAVRKGDRIQLETKFDEIAHPPRQSGGKTMEEMGIMQFTFVPNN